MKHELGQLAEQGSPGLLDGGDCRSTGSAGIGSQRKKQKKRKKGKESRKIRAKK
jgi:hypothetical protein